ncbi:MAG TPA: DUF4870 domain-containing protein [Candidatus Pseudogracilibacillus intestinigallinarum]|uniref:DUF4870 domain-containing protein n=1 Tax=Candidatus Pseudogracilibacillus intestinigallinarum TaxID=2838742 RepID=A0A9D1TKQ6_9BACI|nr:DUF4870 domain-containing protein [Candidatus Pseudogracilibacillus intestinigallinarum]
MTNNRTTIFVDGDKYYVEPNNDERIFAMLIYLTSFFTTIIGPLLIWLLKRDDSKFVDFHGKNYLNFLISFVIYGIIAVILKILLIGFILLPIVGLLVIIFTIFGAIKAYQGEWYSIPFTIKFIR